MFDAEMKAMERFLDIAVGFYLRASKRATTATSGAPSTDHRVDVSEREAMESFSREDLEAAEREFLRLQFPSSHTAVDDAAQRPKLLRFPGKNAA